MQFCSSSVFQEKKKDPSLSSDLGLESWVLCSSMAQGWIYFSSWNRILLSERTREELFTHCTPPTLSTHKHKNTSTLLFSVRTFHRLLSFLKPQPEVIITNILINVSAFFIWSSATISCQLIHQNREKRQNQQPIPSSLVYIYLNNIWALTDICDATSNCQRVMSVNQIYFKLECL